MTPDAKAAKLRIAVLDLNDNTPNEGMRAIRELLAAQDGLVGGVPFEVEVFDVRHRGEVPGLDHDVYVSSGGPGSPFDGEGKAWERDYFTLLGDLWDHNGRSPTDQRKHGLFICHSFQLMVRFFEVAEVVQRRSPSFGIFPIHKTKAGFHDPLLSDLPEPFYAADFRRWQVVGANADRLQELGAAVLCREKIRPHVELERAVMGVRLSPELVGVQFHPEADPPGMNRHFRKPKRRQQIIADHGADKYARILHRLEDPAYLAQTYRTIIPAFLRDAVTALRPDHLLGRVA